MQLCVLTNKQAAVASKTTMIHEPPSQTYRQKYVAVTLIKVSIRLLWDLYQLHFLCTERTRWSFYFKSTK